MPAAREPDASPWRAAWRRLRAAAAGWRGRLADRKAELLRRWVAGASDDGLESVMRGPLRRVLLWQIFATMRQRFDGDRGRRVEAVIEIRIGRPGRQRVDRYQLFMAGGRCRRPRHRGQAARVILEIDSVSFLRLVGGAAGAPGLLVTGKLKVGGDFLLAARLPTLLKIPRTPVLASRRRSSSLT